MMKSTSNDVVEIYVGNTHARGGYEDDNVGEDNDKMTMRRILMMTTTIPARQRRGGR